MLPLSLTLSLFKGNQTEKERKNGCQDERRN